MSLTARRLGPEGEALAVRYLESKGLRIIHKNYKTPIGEADIVALKEGITVFIEVKARSSSRFGEPFEAVGSRKQEKLKKIASFYQKQKGSEIAVRFDIVSIKIQEGSYEIEHIEGAF